MPLPRTMSGVQLTGHGGPEALEWRDDLPVPEPGRGQVLVRILAAGVNNTDINTRLGWYSRSVTGATTEDAVADEASDGAWSGALAFPRIQGGDLCGEVVEPGPGTQAPPLGTRVTCPTVQPEPGPGAPTRCVTIGSEYDGAFAQYCVVPARHLYDVSTSPLTDTEIAAIPCAFGTAAGMLARAGVRRGQRVLVTGASGGVGMAAVMLATHHGAEVTGMTSPDKADAVRAAGAVALLDREETPPPASFDVVIEVVGGPGWQARLDALRPGGVLSVSGAIAGPVVPTDLRQVYLNDLTIAGSTYQPAEVFAELVDLIRSGEIRPHVSRTYPLREIAQAQADFLSKQYAGKLVLIPERLAS